MADNTADMGNSMVDMADNTADMDNMAVLVLDKNMAFVLPLHHLHDHCHLMTRTVLQGENPSK
ncbi:hypothetical protein NLX67_08245 [Domibacillus sp. A3M-37]|uniref:hypothetical protein n=1 Tax=Domibacillus sp. A3M-37 TaxID=2962037 RepID=UPI0020B6A7B0|nr:hypothetical protein [Domibacillus sp. A3M-37]MCP3762379.1 hypothetical protein [Domibacillus sp. A3M-37]